MLKFILFSVWRNLIWVFFAFLMMLSGLGNAINPEKFVPMAVLNNISTVLIQIFGVLLFLGGISIILGIILRPVYPDGSFAIESSGYWLVLPAIAIAFVIFATTGNWNRISVDITYFLFFLAIVSRITDLRREFLATRAARQVLEGKQ